MTMRRSSLQRNTALLGDEPAHNQGENPMNRNAVPDGARRAVRLTAAAALAALVLAGCSAGGGEDEEEGTDDPVEITFWTWLPDIQKTVDLFEDAHPEISVKVENVGVGVDEYTKIQNAVDAGSGGPDVAHMTYDAIPNFALTGALADIAQTGGESVPDLFLPGVVSLVQRDEAIYGVPQDFGPAVMFYRADVFEQLGLEVPATWDEYAAAAEAIHAANPGQFITHIDPGLTDAAYMGLWQLDAKPWTVVDDSTVTIDLESSSAVQWADYWSDLNNADLLVESVQGSDEWFKQLNDGVWVTWIVGAWGLQALTGNVPDGEGLWRVAPQPQWSEGDQATSQFGGSATVILDHVRSLDELRSRGRRIPQERPGTAAHDDRGLGGPRVHRRADPLPRRSAGPAGFRRVGAELRRRMGVAALPALRGQRLQGHRRTGHLRQGQHRRRFRRVAGAHHRVRRGAGLHGAVDRRGAEPRRAPHPFTPSARLRRRIAAAHAMQARCPP
jgi:multiple sugar transport system substrate-binding protein